MELVLYQWDGHAINDTTNYQSVIHPSVSMPAATATFIDMGNSNPILAGKVLDGGYFTFTVVCRGTVETQRDELNKWFKVTDFTFRKLTAKDPTNGDKIWYLEGYPIAPPRQEQDKPTQYTITLALSSPYWIENDLQTNTWNITSGTETEAMTNAGNVAALPKIVLTPNNAKGSNAIGKRTFLAIHTSGYGGYLYMDVVNALLDTASMITAGDLLASGDDLNVVINGQIMERQIVGLDSATTSVWTWVSFSPAPAMTLVTSLNNSTLPAAIVCNFTAPGAVTLAQNSSIQIGTEIISYSQTEINYNNGTITFTPTQRAAKGSGIAAHSPAVDVFWIENDIWLTFKNSAAVAPPTPSNPACFDIAASTNALHSYLAFSLATTQQQNATVPVMIGGTGHYGFAGAFPRWVIPYEVLGLVVGNTFLADFSYPQTGGRWEFTEPGGISNFAANGSKYRSGTDFAVGTVDTNINNNTTVFYTEASPSLAATIEAVAIDQAITGNPQRLKWTYRGTVGAGQTTYIEFTDVALTIYDPPTVTALGVEQVNYNFNGTLKNNTTGDIINLNNVNTKTAESITLDCDNQEIYSTDGKRLRSNITFAGPRRDEWLTLEPGANSIVFADVGTNDVTIVTTWRGRNTI